MNNNKADKLKLLDNNGTEKYRQLAKKLKEEGVTKEMYLEWWNREHPLVEKERTDELIEILYHYFE